MRRGYSLGMEFLGTGASPHRGQVAAAAVLALGIVIASGVGSYAFYRVRAFDNTLTVTGSAKQAVSADIAKWTVSVQRTSLESGIPATTDRIAADTQAVADFFRAGGIEAGKILVQPISVDQEYSSDANAPRRYSIRQQIAVESDDPQLIADLSLKTAELSRKGILISSYQPEYFVSTLPDIRISLIGAATKDAQARAEEIAKSTGQSVGALKSASGGVVQVLAPNSIEVSDYGSYDTSTIEKEVMVTSRATFFVR